MSKQSGKTVRIYHHAPVHGTCDLCHRPARMSQIDLDREVPICGDCVGVTVQAAAVLHAAGLVPPSLELIDRNPQ